MKHCKRCDGILQECYNGYCLDCYVSPYKLLDKNQKISTNEKEFKLKEYSDTILLNYR